jgi:hypothetical protein
MFNQYHRLGWQLDYKAEEQYWNEEDLRVNPIVVMNIPNGIAGPDPVKAACEAYGAVKTINRPEGKDFAFVTYRDDAAAKDAIAGGIALTCVDASANDSPNADTGADAGAEKEPAEKEPVRVRPAKYLYAPVLAWRREIKARRAVLHFARRTGPHTTAFAM